jgi:ubiquinone/menaquinone biosynthesis C-methylase UbiE
MISSIERQREHFDQISKKYSESRKNPNHLLLKDLIWRSFFDGKNKLVGTEIKLLEPMCGMGEGLHIVKNYLQKDVHYTGFDYSEEMVKIARELNPGQNIQACDATTYDNQGALYDWIVLIGGLHHVYAQAESVVSRLSRALPSGGYFLNFEPTQNCWLTRKAREYIYGTNSLFDEETERGFELKDLDAMFENAGFEKVDQVFPGLLSYILYYNPDAFPALNLGGGSAVRAAFSLDRVFWRTWLAKKLSFATITLWRLK